MSNKLQVVNAALAIFAPDTTVRRGMNGWIVEWTNHHRKTKSRRWSVDSSNSFYPVWEKEWPHGGTCCMALSQLMRWLQNRPVLGLGTWMHWTSPQIGIGGPNSSLLLEILRDGGYPSDQICVLCQKKIDPRKDGLDWWHLDKISGPCCTNTTCQREARS